MTNRKVTSFVLPDCSDVEAYAKTKHLTRLGWAWEFLRRNPHFRKDLARVLGDAELIENADAFPVFRSATDLSHWGILFRGIVRR